MEIPFGRFFHPGIKWNYIFLFLVIFTIFIIPLFRPGLHRSLYDISYTLIFLVGYLISDKRHSWFVPMAVGAVLLVWIASIFRLRLLFGFSSVLNIILFAVVVLGMARDLTRSKTVTSRLIIESIIIYLLFGLIFAMVIGLIILYDPAAFNFQNISGGIMTDLDHTSDYIYFTFVTLTTTGFGDVTPQEPYSRSLTLLIAITGQMYIAIIIAMLVGKYATQVKIDQNE